jgi:hypothetical protein
MDAAVGRHRAMLVVVGMLALGVVAGAVLLWPRGEIHRPAAAGQQDPTRLVSATLIRVQPLEARRPTQEFPAPSASGSRRGWLTASRSASTPPT